MKKILFVLAVLFCAPGLFAQTPKDSLLSLMAADICKNLSDSKITGASSGLETQMAEAFIPLLTTYADGIAKYYDLENDSEGKGYKQLGIDVGIKMMSVCPVVMKSLVKQSSGEKQDMITTPKTMSLSGTLIKIVPGEFTYVTIKTSAGQIQKLWWMDYFEGADKLTTDMYNKPVLIQYYEKEIYNSALKDYVKIKILAGVK